MCGQEIFGVRDAAGSRDGSMDRMKEIGVRIDSGQLGGLAQRVEERGDLRATLRA